MKSSSPRGRAVKAWDVTPDRIQRSLGIDPEHRIASPGHGLSAAVWRYQTGPTFELAGPASDETHIVSVPVAGRHHHTYFADGRRKYSRVHPAFHMNMVTAGEAPRGVFVSQQPITCLHVYVPDAMVQRLASESAAIGQGRSVTLIDPMCSPDPYVETICRQLLREMTRTDHCSRLMLDVLGQQLAIRLIREHSNVSGTEALASKTGPGYRDWRLRLAIDYLEAHMTDDVGLREVAVAVGLSTRHLVNIFREGTGEPPHRWLMRRRFDKACELLGDPSLSVGDIAHRCGFATAQHLANVMRRRLGTTPTAYRRDLLS